jgi:aminopeptidase N
MKALPWLLMLLWVQAKAQPTSCKTLDDLPNIERKAFEASIHSSLRSQASNNFDVNFYRCTWKVDPAIRYINGQVVCYFTITAATNNIILDLSNQLTVDSVLYRSQKINFTQGANATLQLNLPLTLSTNSKDSVSVFYKGVPDNTGFGSFIKDSHNGVPVIWTLSEPYGSKDWWPCKNGLDDKADSIDITIIHPAAYKATANGLLQSETTNSGSTNTFYKHRYPIASYLVAFSVTNFTVFNHTAQLGITNLPVISYVYPESLNDFQPYTNKVLDAMQLFHNSFGPYPFIKEKYGHTQFLWGGGMEHQTNSFIVSADNGLMAHELGHQWFGDKITCGSWQDIWLNEGFATFATNYYFEKFDTTAYRLTMINHLARVVSQPDGSVFVIDTSNVNNIFNSRLVYYKGAFVLRMLRFTLGDSLFFAGLRQYQQDPTLQYGFAKIADFKRNMEQVSKQDLTYFFNQWIYGQGYPSFNVQWSQNNNQWAKIIVSQTTSHSSVPFFKTPLALTFKNASKQKTVIVQCNTNNAESWADIGFVADTVLVDVDLQLVSKNNSSSKLAPVSNILNDVKIYPNPIGSQFSITIKNPTEKQIQVAVFNSAGQLVFSKIITTPGQDELLQIDCSNWARGAYTLKLQAGNSIQMVKQLLK